MLQLIPGEDTRLTLVSEPFTDDDISTRELTSFIYDLYFLMVESNAIGIAAPQVGVNKRLFIMDNIEGGTVYINPAIIKSSIETYPLAEGCLSFPGEKVQTTRSKVIHVGFTNQAGKLETQTLSDIWAVCFQHELDHLNGITFHDYI